MTATGEHLLGTYARFPVTFARGEGARLWDDAGTEYLDFLTGISVSSVGHRHPAVERAIVEQAGRLLHVGNLYFNAPMSKLADRLATGSLGGGVSYAHIIDGRVPHSLLLELFTNAGIGTKIRPAT